MILHDLVIYYDHGMTTEVTVEQSTLDEFFVALVNQSPKILLVTDERNRSIHGVRTEKVSTYNVKPTEHEFYTDIDDSDDIFEEGRW